MDDKTLDTFKNLPPQRQTPPGEQEQMVPKPIEEVIPTTFKPEE